MKKIIIVLCLLAVVTLAFAWNALKFHAWNGFSASDTTVKGLSAINYVVQQDTDADGANWIYYEDGWANRWTDDCASADFNSVIDMNYQGGDGSVATTGGNWYMFNFAGNPQATPTEPYAILETSAQPVQFVSISQDPLADAISDSDDVTVSVELTASPCVEEIVYLVYTTDAWTSKNYIEIDAYSRNSTADAIIPAQNAGTLVSYYTFTTTVGQSSWDTQNIDYLTLYYDNNVGNNYSYTVGGSTTQEVTVTFRCNVGQATPTAVSVYGNVFPINLGEGTTTLTDANSDKIYETSVVFPVGSSYEVQYKFYTNDGTATWTAETLGVDRSFTIDDSGSTQVLSVVGFSNAVYDEITAIDFKEANNSSFTNFDPDDILDAGSDLKFEVALTGVDVDDNSSFSATLHYYINSGSEETKALQVTYNDTGAGTSYWQTTLTNGVDIADGDDVEFWVTATDYNGPVVTDNNSFSNYIVSLNAGGLAQDVTVNISVNLGAIPADSVSIQGNGAVLNWDAGSSPVSDANEDRIFTFDILFPAGSPYNVQYKFTKTVNAVRAWDWESVSNRSFTIIDTAATMTLPLNTWNNTVIAELTAVQLLEDAVSDYSNFTNLATLPGGTDILLEVELDNVDLANSSGFYAYVRYVSMDAYHEKDFLWNSNSEQGNSYWRVQLVNGVDFFNGEDIVLEVYAGDYNGPELMDNNDENEYMISIGMGTLDPPVIDSIIINGNNVEITFQNVANATAYDVYFGENYESLDMAPGRSTRDTYIGTGTFTDNEDGTTTWTAEVSTTTIGYYYVVASASSGGEE